MNLPDGFVLEERYESKAVAEDDLADYKEIMGEMFCPLSNKSCRADCMFYSGGYVKTLSDGTFDLILPTCNIFLGGSR